MDETVLKHSSGKEIHLSETDDIVKLKNQLLLLGMNGLFYTPVARGIQEKIEELEKRVEKNEEV